MSLWYILATASNCSIQSSKLSPSPSESSSLNLPIGGSCCPGIIDRYGASVLWIGTPSTVLATEVSAMEDGSRLPENLLIILPGLAITGVAGNPTGGRVKVKLAGIPSD